jgi:hypothetical protein
MAVAVATTAILPPRSNAVAMKTPASTAMACAQTINNQQKAATATTMETATITATKMTMEMKATLVAVVWWQRRRRGSGAAVV